MYKLTVVSSLELMQLFANVTEVSAISYFKSHTVTVPILLKQVKESNFVKLLLYIQTIMNRKLISTITS